MQRPADLHIRSLRNYSTICSMLPHFRLSLQHRWQHDVNGMRYSSSFHGCRLRVLAEQISCPFAYRRYWVALRPHRNHSCKPKYCFWS